MIKTKDIRMTVRLNEKEEREFNHLYHTVNKMRCKALGITAIEENYSMNKSDVIRYLITYSNGNKFFSDYDF